jgi:hypothetical protein
MSPQNVANLCVRCFEKFDAWSTYHEHVTRNLCKKEIKPYNITGRDKRTIVAEWEAKQKQGAII